jgi:eukaryotic-like serine/threonine-protein kinase
MADTKEKSPSADRAGEIDRTALEDRVGTVVGKKWTLKKLLGAGAFAAVYEAEHSIGRRDAIKILHPDLADSDEWKERFRREARAANQVEHPGIVQVVDTDVTDDGTPFLVMELVSGETLSRKIAKQAKLTSDDALELADQLLDILCAAHAAGIVHRDVKPQNLIVDERGQLRVLDFGVARLLRGQSGKRLTEAGVALGTIAYMPREQLKGDDVDARADIYAVGATLFRLLTGRPVFTADTEGELAEKILNDAPPGLSEAAPDLDEGVAAIVDRALSPDPADRFASAREMQTAVREKLGRPPVSEEDARTVKRALKDEDEQAAVAVVAPEEDAPTVKRDVDEDDSKTVKREGAGVTAVAGDAAAIPGKTVSATLPGDDDDGTTRKVPPRAPPPAEPRGAAGGWVIAAALALVAVVVWGLTRGGTSESPDTEGSTPTRSTPTAAAPTTEPGDPVEPTPAEAELPDEPAPGDPDGDESEPSPGATGPAPTAKPTSTSTSAPSKPPIVLPTSLPTALPSGWPVPSGMPTALPSGLPSIPSGLPKFPPPPPAPTPPPPPAAPPPPGN